MCHSTIGDIGAGLCRKEKEHESEEETFVFLSAEKQDHWMHDVPDALQPSVRNVLYRLRGFPPWPCLVVEPQPRKVLQGPMNPAFVLVYSLGDEMYKWARASSLQIGTNEAEVMACLVCRVSSAIDRVRRQDVGNSGDVASLLRHRARKETGADAAESTGESSDDMAAGL